MLIVPLIILYLLIGFLFWIFTPNDLIVGYLLLWPLLVLIISLKQCYHALVDVIKD